MDQTLEATIARIRTKKIIRVSPDRNASPRADDAIDVGVRGATFEELVMRVSTRSLIQTQEFCCAIKYENGLPN